MSLTSYRAAPPRAMKKRRPYLGYFSFFLLFVPFHFIFKVTEFFEDCEDVSMPLADLAATYSPVP